MGEMQTDGLKPEGAVIVPVNSFYKSRLGGCDSDVTSGNIGITSLSHDMRDVKFLRRLLSVKVELRKLKFVQNSRFLVRAIFHKKAIVKIKRLIVSSKVARSNKSEETISSCVTVTGEEELSILRVTFTDDQDIASICDKRAHPSTAVDPIRMSPLSYLKPSQSEDNYGLGSFSEIMKDDADRPLRAIPEWALEDRVRVQMLNQISIDTNRIFAPRVLSELDLGIMFPDKPPKLWRNPFCDSPTPKKTTGRREDVARRTSKKLRF